MACSNSLTTPFVSSGVRQDLNGLFNKFDAIESVRLTDFVSIFREMKFDTILNHRLSPTEYIEHAEYVLQHAGNYFRALDDSQNMRSVASRIFGIYTTYALYHCQPKDYVCKIKVTTQQLGELLDFEKFLITEQHLDAVACLHILISKQAFQIVLFQSDYDPASHKRYITEEETWKITKMDEPFDVLRNLIDGDVFNEICLIHRSYIKGKSNLNIEESHIDAKNPITMMKEIIETHEDLLEKRQLMRKDEMMMISETGASRGDTRSKAYSAQLKHTRNRRYLDPNMDENFAHLRTFGELAQDILEEEDEQQPSTSKEPEKKRRAKKRKEPEFLDDEAEASEVLKRSLNGIFKPLEDVQEKEQKPAVQLVTTVDLSSETKPKTKVPDVVASRLRKFDRVRNVADKAMERIESRIRMEAESEEI